jgi:hypothetical protein
MSCECKIIKTKKSKRKKLCKACIEKFENAKFQKQDKDYRKQVQLNIMKRSYNNKVMPFDLEPIIH